MYEIGQEEMSAIEAVIKSGCLFRYPASRFQLRHRRESAKFEKEFAAKIGTQCCLAVTSGTAALITALAALEIGPGDEVIVPAFTWVSTAIAPLAVGAIPVIAEIDDTLTIDVKDIDAKITDRTKAIIPVHIAGLTCNLDAVTDLAKRKGLTVVEDVCQAAGGTYKRRRLGSIGDVGCFSFNYYKTIMCGEGGALTTNDPRTYERALIFHDPGSFTRHISKNSGISHFAGTNFRINEILSAVLRVQLKRLDGWLHALRQIRKRLTTELESHPALRPVPLHDPDGGAATHMFFRFADEREALAFAKAANWQSLNAFRPFDWEGHVCSQWDVVMNQRGGHVEAANPFLNPNVRGKHKYYADMCPRTVKLTKETVGIPLSPTWSEKQQDAILTFLRRIAAKIKIH
jgi:dTDP-4-amino-4,6-dideoxygalactose transaminase